MRVFYSLYNWGGVGDVLKKGEGNATGDFLTLEVVVIVNCLSLLREEKPSMLKAQKGSSSYPDYPKEVVQNPWNF